MNKAGLLGYAGNWNNEGIIAMQVETASCIENIVEIAAVPGVDILFLGRTICACRWASTTNTSSRTCTPRPS